MEKRSYTEDLNIDKDSLEIEWEKQPRLFIYWAEREVDAQEERDKAQRNMSVIKAEMDAKVRKDPEKYGEPLSGELKGYYKLKISMFRTIYRIDKDKVLVFVIKIGFRRNNEAYLQALSRLHSLGLL